MSEGRGASSGATRGTSLNSPTIPTKPHPSFPQASHPGPNSGPNCARGNQRASYIGGPVRGFVVRGKLKASRRALGEHGRIRRESCRRGHKHTGFSPIGAYREPLGVPGKPSGKPDPLIFWGAWGACAPSIIGIQMYIYVKVRSTHLATLVTFEMTTLPGHRQSPRMSAREWEIKTGPWAPQKDSRGFSRGALGGPNP